AGRPARSGRRRDRRDRRVGADGREEASSGSRDQRWHPRAADGRRGRWSRARGVPADRPLVRAVRRRAAVRDAEARSRPSGRRRDPRQRRRFVRLGRERAHAPVAGGRRAGRVAAGMAHLRAGSRRRGARRRAAPPPRARSPERRAPQIWKLARARRRSPARRCRHPRARSLLPLRMKVGLQLVSFTWPGGAPQIARRLAEIARTAEEAGFHSLWVMYHYFQIPPWGKPEDHPMLEAYSTLGYLAAATERIRLGALVSGVIYRPPAVLIKAATTVDVLAGGRTYFGVGAAWFKGE